MTRVRGYILRAFEWRRALRVERVLHVLYPYGLDARVLIRLENAPVVLKTKTPLASGLEFELRDENYIVGKLTTLAT